MVNLLNGNWVKILLIHNLFGEMLKLKKKKKKRPYKTNVVMNMIGSISTK